FVATNTEGIKLAAVKGQDNIVFLARKDGVVIDNAVLKGCDDKTLYDGGKINLSLLNCMGTTLEIMANVTLTHSRVMNGRTAVRVFGRDNIDIYSDVNTAREKIAVTIDGCVLQNAREFVLKIGTNRVIRGTNDNISPALYDKQGNAYDKHNSPDCDAYMDDEYFVSNYVLTDVTLKDSILRTSGMFTVGMESHFAGPMLANSTGAIIKLDGWKDLAATSYPAILHLVGDVVLADWKTISSVDSSTLIESNTTQSNLSFLALDIAEMLQAVQKFGGDKYKNLIAEKKGEKYAHGGIAFYGGGKNYSILDTSEYTFERMHDYNINLSILQGSGNPNVSSQGWMLPLAAGEEDFRFVLFDGTSEFDYEAQSKM
ncbi:MAG: hypothetical protein K2M36_00950, partial [Clostridia bacterium]|nr:hypothetical protein [Clostridia bacterium]